MLCLNATHGRGVYGQQQLYLTDSKGRKKREQKADFVRNGGRIWKEQEEGVNV